MNKEAQALKNYIHNTLKIPKEDIHNIMLEVIKEELREYVKREIQQKFKDTNINKIITDEIIKSLKENNGRWFNNDRQTFIQEIGKEVAKNIEIKLKL